MDFGKVPESELDKIDLTLPDDHTDTERILKSLKGKKKQKVYVGCAKWGRKEWVGKIYPPKTKEKDFVFHYVKQFNSIELNATHYRLPETSSIEKWKQDAAKDFRFCPKFPQWISHIRRLKDCQAETDRFISVVSGFNENLGTSFLQMPPNFAPKNITDIEKYLKSLPKDFKVVVEFRHPDWFKDTPAANDAFEMLNKLKAGTVITDAAGRRDCVHMRLTNPTAFIRFVGNSLHKTDFTRVDDWVKRIKKWMDAGLETIYFMMHMHDEKDSPELVTFSIKKLNKECGLDLKVPVFYDNGELFAKVL